jgi:hypothetical protein
MTGAGGVLASLSPRIRLFRLRLLQPVRHPHLAVHRRRGGEMLLGLLALVRAPVELAEAEVAVGDEGARSRRIPAEYGLPMPRQICAMAVGERLHLQRHIHSKEATGLLVQSARDDDRAVVRYGDETAVECGVELRRKQQAVVDVKALGVAVAVRPRCAS